MTDTVVVNIDETLETNPRINFIRYLRFRLAYIMLTIFKWTIPSNKFTPEIFDMINSVPKNDIEYGYAKKLN